MEGHRKSTLALLFAALFFLFGATAHGNLENLDSTMTMHAARALVLRGDSGLKREQPDWIAEGLIAEQIGSGRSYGMRGDNGLYYVWFPMGHIFLMAPAVAVGEGMHSLFPSVEQRYRETVIPPHYPYGMRVWDHALVAFLPALFGAASGVVLFLLARTFGLATRESLLVLGAVVFCTQLFPLTREPLSDGPGMFFLLAGLLGVLRWHFRKGGGGTLLLAGFLCGWAVLTRYPHAILVAALLGFLLWSAWRRRELPRVAWFLAGGLPCALLLLGVNHSRFGDPTETGYGNAAVARWFDYPFYLGLPKVLIAAGKGILWFTPLLWMCVPAALRRDARGPLVLLAWIMLALPVLLFSNTLGWQSGQCWGIRYVTPGVVTFVAMVLCVARPWRSHPRLFAVLCGLGALLSLTSVLAPTRGYTQLAGQAVLAHYEAQRDAGVISQADLEAVDPPDHYFFLPRYSPIHGHWTYALQALRGRFEDEHGRPVRDPARTIEPLFGVTSDDPDHGLAPIHWEDRSFRHLWWRFWGELLEVPGVLLLLGWLLAAALLVRGAWRRLHGELGVKTVEGAGR